MTSVIDQPWFVPGDTSASVFAGSADPNVGALVCMCSAGAVPGVTSLEQANELEHQLAQHIVKVHNTDLARRVVERQMGVRD
jgi:hypothetical protein